MVETFYDLVQGWTKGEWNGDIYRSIVNNVSRALSTIGHGDTPLGNAMFDLWDWFEEATGPVSIGTWHHELQKELADILKESPSEILKTVEIATSESPDLKISILNIDELRATADPKHQEKARKRLDEMLSDFIDEEF
ncbi:MAG: hypothetical protein ACFFEF_06155 [Candidatus Thorarchaeota archaeon]